MYRIKKIVVNIYNKLFCITNIFPLLVKEISAITHFSIFYKYVYAILFFLMLELNLNFKGVLTFYK